MRGHSTPPVEQLPLPVPPPPAKPRSVIRGPEAAAKVAIARRGKTSAVPGHVKLTLTVDLERELAERLSARAIREGKNFEAAVIEILQAGRTLEGSP